MVSKSFALAPTLLAFVSEHMKKAGCPAHDLAHCFRVANLAMKIARDEPLANLKVTYVGAMLHDVLDAKLYGPEKIVEVESFLRDKLIEHQQDPHIATADDQETIVHLTPDEVDQVFQIVKSVGYKNLIKPDWDALSMSIEYRCVQDADLLDAIGAIGISRTFSFGGKHARHMFGPFSMISAKEKLDPAAYAAYQKDAQSNTVAHFFDKLLRLKDFMTTETGKTMARERHNTMLLFLRVLDAELEESDDPAQGYIEKYIGQFDESADLVSSTTIAEEN